MLTPYTRRLTIEVVFLGVFFAVVGSLTSRATMWFGGKNRGEEFSFWNIEWNKFFQLELLWFGTAAFAHLLFEFTGLNTWYLTNGAARLLLRGRR